MSRDPESVVLEYLEDIKAGRHDAAYEAFAEDATWTTPPSLPWPGKFHGRRAIFDGYFAVDKGLFTTGMDSYDLETRLVVSRGEHVVIEMTHRSTGLNGNHYETDHCLVFDVREGKIQAVREYIDSLYLKESMIDPVSHTAEASSPPAWQTLDAVIRPGDPQPEGWYAVALSEEIREGKPFGCDFLGGRVVVYRRASGEPVVTTARCPHMGADLALGDVVGDDIRCTYHHFCFGPTGACTSIPSEGPIPTAARLYSYPTAESLGLVWAYNGPAGGSPLFPPPRIRDYDESDLLVSARRTNVFEVAPWLSIGNTFDFMHLRYVHDLDFEIEPDDVRYVDDHHIELEIPFVSPETGAFEQRIRVTGTNAVSFQTVTDHTTIGLFTSTPLQTTAQTYYVAAVPRDASLAPSELEARLAEQVKFGSDLLVDDARTLTGIRFKVGSLVGGDRAMVTYMQWVNDFPTAAPARAYD